VATFSSGFWLGVLLFRQAANIKAKTNRIKWDFII